MGLKTRGFTLIEVLVVVALIAIFATVLGLAFRGESTVALDAGTRTAAAVLQSTRSHAVLQSTEARFIILDDASDSRGQSGRYYGVVYRDPESSSANPEWIAVSDGQSLPEGVYLDAFRSRLARGTMRLPFPRNDAVPEGSGSQWSYIAFDATGQLDAEANGDDSTMRLVFGIPVITGPDDVDFNADTPRAGFVVLPSGTVVVATDEDELEEAN